MKMRKHMKAIVYLCVILVLVLVALYSGLQILESTVLFSGTEENNTYHSKTITRNGVDYYPRQDVTTVLVLGIDQSGPVKASESYTNQGAADLVMLLVFDETRQVCDILQLNRDTMLKMPVLGLGGRKAGTFFGQLALSHTYGTGLADSCENTVETVSDFLYGITVDHYVAMNMDAIAVLNDAVGGVTVNVTEDFSQVDATIGSGQVTLTGQQALHYVRSRQGLGDQLNVSRMERHRKYVDGFMKAFKEQKEETPEFFAETYEAITPYIVTDCTVNTLTGMIERYGDYTLNQPVTPEGENRMGEKYYEFHVDEQKLDTLILEMFFAPKK